MSVLKTQIFILQTAELGLDKRAMFREVDFSGAGRHGKKDFCLGGLSRGLAPLRRKQRFVGLNCAALRDPDEQQQGRHGSHGGQKKEGDPAELVGKQAA